MWSSQYCLNHVCQGQAATCQAACKDHQSGPTTQYVYGCNLSRYSNDYAETMNYYGAASTEATARNEALDQCRAANFTEWFCTGASIGCQKEPLAPYSCTWSNYSNDFGQTIYYYGSGSSQTAAKAAAVQACLDSGKWQGWFCGAGAVSCSAE